MSDRLKVSHEQVTRSTAQANALARRLADGVSKRALAEAIAARATVRGIVDGRTAAQIEADLMAELRRYETVCALRQAGRKSGKEQR